MPNLSRGLAEPMLYQGGVVRTFVLLLIGMCFALVVHLAPATGFSGDTQVSIGMAAAPVPLNNTEELLAPLDTDSDIMGRFAEKLIDGLIGKMFERTVKVCRIDLSKEESKRTFNAAGLISADPASEQKEFCRQAQLYCRGLPERLRKTLLNFADPSNGLGIMVITNVEVDGGLEGTPPNNTAGLACRTHFVKQMSLIAHHFGFMVAYEGEAGGKLLQDVVPNKDHERLQTSQGSGTELEAHTEQCFSEKRPDYLILGCLRGDQGAHTYFYSVKQLLQHFSDGEIAELRKPLWTTTFDESFKDLVPNPKEVRGPFPILHGSDEDLCMRVDQDLMRGLHEVAQKLLEKVVQIYIQHRDAYCLSPGDVFILDNNRVMHGRSPFLPHFDGNDRFLARGFVANPTTYGRLEPFMFVDTLTVAAAHS